MSWRDEAACVGVPVDVFFPGVGESIWEALELCLPCPVRAECLDWCLSNLSSHYDMAGVWGGTSPRDRRAIRRGTLTAAEVWAAREAAMSRRMRVEAC